jgi:hypothetical protein
VSPMTYPATLDVDYFDPLVSTDVQKWIGGKRFAARQVDGRGVLHHPALISHRTTERNDSCSEPHDGLPRPASPRS